MMKKKRKNKMMEQKRMNPMKNKRTLSMFLVALLLEPLHAFGVDPMIAKLQAIDPLPKVTPSWHWTQEERIMGNPELAKALSDVLRCYSLSLRWASVETLQVAVAADPETIALHWSPWHSKFMDHRKRWTKAESCGPLTPKDLEYLGFFWSKAVAARIIIPKSIPIIIILDHEQGCGDNEDLAVRLNMMFRMAKQVFGGEVTFYNDRQFSPRSGAAQHLPRSTSPIPLSVSGDFPSLSMYYNINSSYTRRVLEFTAAESPGDFWVWLSYGNEYELYPFTPVGKRRRSKDVIAWRQPGEAWWAGYWLYNKFPAKFESAFGPVGRVAKVCLWPPPLRVPKSLLKGKTSEEIQELRDLSDRLFIEFLNGANGKRRSIS